MCASARARIFGARVLLASACISADDNVIQVGRTFLMRGVRHRCEIRGEQVTYEQSKFTTFTRAVIVLTLLLQSRHALTLVYTTTSATRVFVRLSRNQPELIGVAGSATTPFGSSARRAASQSPVSRL